MTPDRDDAPLSRDELAIAPERPIASAEIREARLHYDLILLTARRCGWELENFLSAGISREGARKARGLVNSFAWANVALGRAAAEVCRLEGLNENDVVWEILL